LLTLDVAIVEEGVDEIGEAKHRDQDTTKGAAVRQKKEQKANAFALCSWL
jgi:hypothetical protein